ncbi:MAG TPA: M56 family metallopeptidase [Sedimentisphaerales bacterium]|nr:M56 family metallopeptidase [Sedimentisphaerales bacterium]
MESLTIQLRPFFDWLLWVSLQGSVLIALIVLVQIILRGRLPIRWHYLLWVLLLIRLAVPWLPESKISVFNLLPLSIQQGRIIEAFSEPQSAHGMGIYLYGEYADDQKAKPEDDSESVFVRFVRMVPLLWLLGTVVLAVYVCAGNFHLWWLVTCERPLTDQNILDLLEDCKSEMGIRTILGVVITDKVTSPALFGFIRPRLLLPAGMLEALNLTELHHVFLHELAHLKRYDIYLGYLSSLLQVLHWFNPLIWLAFYRIRNDRELACDYLVLSRTKSGQSKDYGRTIVYLLERFSRPRHLPAMAGILETKSQLKRRIKMIAEFKKTSRPRWAGAMLLLVVLACLVLTNAYVAKADIVFGIPTNLGPTINSSSSDWPPSISADGLSLYFCSNRPGGYGDRDIWVSTRPTVYDPWGEPVNLGPTVNSSAWEAFPFISSDGLSLFFESPRPGGYGSFDLWVTTRATKEDPWGEPVNLGPMVNSSSNDATPGISADGLSLFFESDRSGGYGSFDLWVTRRATKTDPSGTPVNLGPTVNSSAWDGGPTISADGLALYFWSKRSGGYGSNDIWVTMRETIHEDWGTPVNLGPTVNTSAYEEPGSISADGLLLFFESDRPGGQGNHDLWLTTRDTTNDPWGEPVNLGPGVNSSAGEGNPSISADGSTLYFGSNRSGGSGDVDLCQVKILPVVDFNGDGKVDTDDLLILIDNWGINEPLCDIGPTPFGDGIVDFKDLEVFMSYWEKQNIPEIPEEEL